MSSDPHKPEVSGGDHDEPPVSPGAFGLQRIGSWQGSNSARKALKQRRGSFGASTSLSADEENMLGNGKLWHDILMRYGEASDEGALEVAEAFARAHLPPPSSDANAYLTHEFMRELGIKNAVLRAKVKLACHRMPDIDVNLIKSQNNSQQSTQRGAAAAHDETRQRDTAYAKITSGVFDIKPRHAKSSYTTDTTIVTLDAFPAENRSYTWYDMRGRDGQDHAPLFEGMLHRLKARIENVPESDLPDPCPTIIDSILALKLPLPQMIVDVTSPSECVFVLRVCTWDVEDEDDTVRELTNRWTVYVNQSKQVVATIHRVDSVALADMRDTWAINGSKLNFRQLISKIFERFLTEFDRSITRSIGWLDNCELLMLNSSQDDSILKGLFHLQRRASVYDRMVDLTKDFMTQELGKQLKIVEEFRGLEPRFGDLKARCEDLQTRAQDLLQIHLSLIGHYNNSLFRVLTKFSMLFTPLTFIASVQGMNFIPSTMFLIEHPQGYWINNGIYAIIAICMILWIKFGIEG